MLVRIACVFFGFALLTSFTCGQTKIKKGKAASASAVATAGVAARDYTKEVNVFVGTAAHGHTYPGAVLPFGMVQLSPDTRVDQSDGSSGYHYSDSTIMGFSHTHLSGTGVSDYGDILVMPTTGAVLLQPGNESKTSPGYRSRFRTRTNPPHPATTAFS